MLVLTRHCDEKLLVILEDGREIEIVIVDIRGDKVRLGINAPKEIEVHREEVWREIQRENRNGI